MKHIAQFMKRYIILILSFLTSSCWLMAQPYIIKRLGIEQGLSNNYVVGITQDKQGFLWFATEEGLNKFDGTRFITYYKNDPSKNSQSITGNELNQVYADPKRPIIWVATQRDGLNAYNYHSQTFTAYQNDPQNPNSLITNDVTDIAPAQDTDGIWICTYYRGIDHLDTATGKFTHYNKTTVPTLESEQTWTVLDGGDGNLYIGHVNSGFSILSLKDRSTINFRHDPADPNSLPGNEVSTILKDSYGNIWLGTDRGLALYNSTNQSFITFKQNRNDKYGTLSTRIFSIRQLKNHKLWIASELNGITILDLKQSQFLSPEQIAFEFLREGDDSRSLSNASVRYIYQDSFDNVWLGTWGGGINFISSEPSLFTTIDYSPIPGNNSSLNNKVVSVYARTDKVVYGSVRTEEASMSSRITSAWLSIKKKQENCYPIRYRPLSKIRREIYGSALSWEVSASIIPRQKHSAQSPQWAEPIWMSVLSAKTISTVSG